LDNLGKKTRFRREGSKITTGVKIEKSKVIFNYDIAIKYPASSITSPKTLKLKHNQTFNSPLFEMYDIVAFYQKSHKEDPDLIAINRLADLLVKRNLTLDRYPVKGLKHDTHIRIIQRKTRDKKPSKSPEFFQFLNKYLPVKRRN